MNLYIGSAKTEAFEVAFRFIAKVILADAAGDDALISQSTRHISEICRSAAKLPAISENIPEQFAEPHRRELFHNEEAACP